MPGSRARRSESLAAEAGREAALGELRLLLGMSPEEALSVRGDLRDRRQFDREALRAERGATPGPARARGRAARSGGGRALARAEAWPDVGLGARYERDEDDDLAFGLVALELPLFQRGQGLRAEASARSRRLRLALEGVTRAADVEVSTACAVHTRREAALAELEANALPQLGEIESLARRSYAAGQIGLSEYQVVERDGLELRRDYADLLLAAAEARTLLETSAGVLR